jgi:hypothetical protein
LAIEPNSFMLAIDGRAQLINGTESPYHGYNEIHVQCLAAEHP